MVDSSVKNFELYGEGYAFDSGLDVKLSSFEFNSGYYMWRQHYGVLDPLIGGKEGPYWYDSVDSASYIIKKLGVAKEWLDYVNNVTENRFTTLTEALEFVIGELEDGMDFVGDNDIIKSKLKLGSDSQGYCIFGVKDPDYFYKIAASTCGDEEEFQELVESDMITLNYA